MICKVLVTFPCVILFKMVIARPGDMDVLRNVKSFYLEP